jgi:hypothetical protein
MTALHAAGGGLPLAVHLPHIVEQIGSLAGFAAVLGLAILSALYFSQARDLKRLREWAGRAPERAAEAAQRGPAAGSPLPGRAAAAAQRSPQAVQQPVPAATPAAAAGAAGPAAPAAPGANGAPPAEGDADPAKEKAAEGAAPAPANGTQAPPDGAATEDGAAKEAEQKKPEAEEAAEGERAGDGDAAKEAAPAKPGMPAPASAAAGAASAAGPAVPAAPGRPSSPQPPPQRPPTSVLPPRTGTTPPVRKIGGTAAANRALGQNVFAPTPEQPQRNRTYVVLAVIGVLVLGAAAAIGVPALVSGGSDTGKKHAAASQAKHVAARPPLKASSITVAVLNGTTITHLAQRIADELTNDGFDIGLTGNAPPAKQLQANSTALYMPGHEREAAFVARKLHISAVEPVDQASKQIAGNADVVLIAGSDLSS